MLTDTDHDGRSNWTRSVNDVDGPETSGRGLLRLRPGTPLREHPVDLLSVSRALSGTVPEGDRYSNRLYTRFGRDTLSFIVLLLLIVDVT